LHLADIRLAQFLEENIASLVGTVAEVAANSRPSDRSAVPAS
jgi:hypothetical protein